LVKTKKYGTPFYLHFIKAQARTLSIDELELIFQKHPELFEGNPFIRELAYVEYFINECKKKVNMETFNTIFNLLLKSKNGTNNDWQFFDIAVASKNVEIIKKCKKVIRSAHIHKEINICLKILTHE
jgi:hypothetical protein